MEERAHIDRIAEFEASTIDVNTAEDLRRSLIDYFRESTFLSAPTALTFTAINALAEIATPSQEQKLIRIESIREPLTKLSIPYERLESSLKSKHPDDAAFVDWFCEEWSRRPDIRRNPISFAAFKDEHLDAIESNNCFSNLRDRLGLRHYDAISSPIPVALMEYTVKSVVRQASAEAIPHAFRVPTAFDSQPYFQFFPTPNERAHGAPMRLSLIESETDLAAEVLHPKLNYIRSNIVKIGYYDDIAVTNPLNVLRNTHLYALKLDALRDDFGMEITA